MLNRGKNAAWSFEVHTRASGTLGHKINIATSVEAIKPIEFTRGPGIEILEVEKHRETCKKLENMLGVPVIEDRPVMRRGAYSAKIIECEYPGTKTYSLETRLRAQKYFLAEGFVVGSKHFFDLRVETRPCTTATGLNLCVEYQTSNTGSNPSIIVQHLNSVESVISSTAQYYHKKLPGKDNCAFHALAFLTENPESSTHVDYWDARHQGLIAGAEKIGKAINNSRLRENVQSIILYGSLARKDKIPDDIDLVMIVDSKDKILEPTKYYVTADEKRPLQYNTKDVTNGLVLELGILPELMSFSTKENDFFARKGQRNAADLLFSRYGGRLNLNTLPAEFFTDSQIRENLMRIKFTPAYYRDILVDGFVYNRTSGKFDVPACYAYSDTINELNMLLEKARKESWGNINNDRPKKKA